jgi:hypothetical protein
MPYVARLKGRSELFLLAEDGLDSEPNLVFDPAGQRRTFPFARFDPSSERELDLETPEITAEQRTAFTRHWERFTPEPRPTAQHPPREADTVTTPIEPRTRDDEVLRGARALADHLRHWFSITNGECRLDGKALDAQRGGISVRLRVRLSGFASSFGPDYNSEYDIAGDTRRSAVELFLGRYDQFAGDVNQIFSAERVASTNPRPKLGLPISYWNCREREP